MPEDVSVQGRTSSLVRALLEPILVGVISGAATYYPFQAAMQDSPAVVRFARMFGPAEEPVRSMLPFLSSLALSAAILWLFIHPMRRPLAALWIFLGLFGAWEAAFWSAIGVYDGGRLASMPELLAPGLVGGFVGAFSTWLTVAVVAPAIRTVRRCVSVAVLGTLAGLALPAFSGDSRDFPATLPLFMIWQAAVLAALSVSPDVFRLPKQEASSAP